MPHHRSRSKISGVAAASAGLWLARGSTAAGLDGSSNVALYWGQNSYNQGSGDLAQQPLATYCANTDIDIIPMAFMVQITSGQGKEPVINFANQQNNCTVFPDTGLLDCPQIGDDIKTCQQKYGKTILLSIGGATYTEGGFTSKDAAIAAANLVWNTFGPTSGSSSSNSSSSSSSAVPSAASNSTSLVGSAHSTTSPALSTGGTGKVAATNASTNLLPTLLTALGVNSTTTAKADKVKSTSKLTTASATTSDEDALTAVTTLLTILEEATSTAKKTLKNKAVETSSSDKHSTESMKETTVEISSHASRSTKTLKHTDTDTSTTVLRMTRTHAAIHRTQATQEVASSKSSTATASASKAATTEANAETLSYSPTHPRRQAQTYRPFHDAVIDGFDLDLETAVQNFNPFAAQLRSLMDADKSKKYYLTAAPQCPYPDAADDSMLNGAAGMDKVNFDAIFVQFYNNYCGTNSYVANATTQNNFNFETWDNWATTKSANKDVKVFLGVPAGQSAAGTGYLSADALKPVIDYCKTFKSFGGVMAWDASQAYANKGFLDGVKTALGDSTKKTRLIRRALAREWWG